MTSKKTAASKRTQQTAACGRLHKVVSQRLGAIIALWSARHEPAQRRHASADLLLIANDDPLGHEWFDHALVGDWDGHRECHISGDFLLAYKLHESGKMSRIVFVRTGTHADLFE